MLKWIHGTSILCLHTGMFLDLWCVRPPPMAGKTHGFFPDQPITYPLVIWYIAIEHGNL